MKGVGDDHQWLGKLGDASKRIKKQELLSEVSGGVEGVTSLAAVKGLSIPKDTAATQLGQLSADFMQAVDSVKDEAWVDLEKLSFKKIKLHLNV